MVKAIAISTLLSEAALAATVSFHPVDLSAFSNAVVPVNPQTYPTGPQEFLGVPFELADNPGAGWFAFAAGGGDETVSLEAPVGVESATAVHALMNTVWGQPQGELITVEFLGSAGATAVFDLVGDDHIRDYNQFIWTNDINGCTTQQVFSNGQGQRLDRITFQLPPEFVSQTIETMRIIDTGATDFSRAFILAATVQSGTCDGDLDLDFDVDSGDLNLLLSQFGTAESCRADLNSDGTVDSADLNVVLAAFGTSCL